MSTVDSPAKNDGFEVRSVGPRGRGLVATQSLPQGIVVTCFDGPVMSPDEVPDAELAYALVLDAKRWMVPDTAARFVNHGCTPNCYVREGGEVVTLRAIASGEEITFDYASVDVAEYLADPAAHAWNERWTFACTCGSALCRGMIDGYSVTGPDHSLPALAASEVPLRGRGVIARRPLRVGELVERAPVIVVPGSDWTKIEHTPLFDYTFEWGEDGQDAALVLGLGSLINHSYQPNLVFIRRYAQREVDFVVLRDVAAGAEVTMNYNGDPNDLSPLWFEVLEPTRNV